MLTLRWQCSNLTISIILVSNSVALAIQVDDNRKQNDSQDVLIHGRSEVMTRISLVKLKIFEHRTYLLGAVLSGQHID